MSNLEKYEGPRSLLLGNAWSNQFDSLVDRLFDSFWSDPAFLTKRNWRPTSYDETDKDLTIRVELPGFKKDEVLVEADNRRVKVEAKNDRSHYSQTFVDARFEWAKANVSLEDGILKIVAPKTEKAKTKMLTVQ